MNLKIFDSINFQWDQGNILKSLVKHKISTDESEQIFSNRPLIILDDLVHSLKEKRYYAYGRTNGNKLLINVFTIRGQKIRVISSRKMNKKEKIIYEEKAKANSQI